METRKKIMGEKIMKFGEYKMVFVKKKVIEPYIRNFPSVVP